MESTVASPTRRSLALLAVLAMVVTVLAMAPGAHAAQSPPACNLTSTGTICTRLLWGGKTASAQTAPGMYSTVNVRVDDYVEYPAFPIDAPEYTHWGVAKASVNGVVPGPSVATFENVFTYEGLNVALMFSGGGGGVGVDVVKAPNSITYKTINIPGASTTHSYNHDFSPTPYSARPSSVRRDASATFQFGAMAASVGVQVRATFSPA